MALASKLVGGIAGAWLLAAVAASGQAVDPPPSLRFALDSRVEWITPVLVRVHYELTNVTSAPLYVAQFPGPAASVSCRTASGGIGGSAGGAWSHDGTLARKYYIQIAPGEALMGHHVVQMPAACVADVQILAVFQAEDSAAWGLTLARGSRFFAEPLSVDLAGRPKAASAAPRKKRARG